MNTDTTTTPGAGPAQRPSADFQEVSLEIAETYESCFVPALFAPIAAQLVDAAGVRAGQRVLDVACGTGAVSRAAAERVGDAALVTGLDLNEAMLAVARRISPDVRWRQGDARALPFGEAEFDVVLCQSGLMFVPEPEQAVREMTRVVAPGGTVGIQLWSSMDRQEGFRPLAEAVARHAGRDAVELVSTYFNPGDPERFTTTCVAAGLQVIDVRTMPVTLHAPSADAYITTEVESTPLVTRISAQVYEAIRADARDGLAQFCTDDGDLAMPFEIFVVIANRP